MLNLCAYRLGRCLPIGLGGLPILGTPPNSLGGASV